MTDFAYTIKETIKYFTHINYNIALTGLAKRVVYRKGKYRRIQQSFVPYLMTIHSWKIELKYKNTITIFILYLKEEINMSRYFLRQRNGQPYMRRAPFLADDFEFEDDEEREVIIRGGRSRGSRGNDGRPMSGAGYDIEE